LPGRVISRYGSLCVGVALIQCLIPDLPPASELLPFLEMIDQSRRYTNSGPLLKRFERELAPVIGSVDACSVVAVSSGTSALEIGLGALELPADALVLTPSLSFPATALAVLHSGAQPVFADVDPRRWMLTPQIAKQMLDRIRIAAIVPVATFGCPQDADAWGDFVTETGIPVLVDAAAALGRQKLDPRILVAYSLHATKPLGVGEGGVLAIGPSALVERSRRLINFGFQFGVVIARGTNAKLSEYAAAVGLAQLARWPKVRDRRNLLNRAYRDAFAGSMIEPQHDFEDAAPATFLVRVPTGGDAAAQALREVGVETHRHPALQGYGPVALPVTDTLADELLGLPFHSHLTLDDVGAVAGKLKSIVCGEPAHV
jgi:dTDP-4-amino-4,6-dideoxygalactose transaminase